MKGKLFFLMIHLPLSPKPPNARRGLASEGRSAHLPPDEYDWMRVKNWREVLRNPNSLCANVRAHLEAENAYTDATMADTAALRRTLFNEMKGRLEEEDCSVPLDDGPWSYFVQSRGNAQYPSFYRRPRHTLGQVSKLDELLLDGNLLAKNKSCFSLGAVRHDPSHRFLAYSFDGTGSEFHTLRIRDLSNGEDSPDLANNASGGFAWSSDSLCLYYVRLNERHHPCRVYRHEVGRPPETDTLISEENDPAFFLKLDKTQDGCYIKIITHGPTSTEIRLLDAAASSGTPRLLAPRKEMREYDVEHNRGLLYFLHNEDAEDFCISFAPLYDSRPENWQILVPHQSGRLILSIHMLSEYLVREEMFNGLPRITVRRLRDGAEHSIAFEEREAYALTLKRGYEFNSSSLRFVRSSMAAPARTFDHNAETGERTERKVQILPDGCDVSCYISRRLHASGHDGAMVPVSILYHRDTPLDGSAPLCLYGYGAYGINVEAGFSIPRLSLVDRGFVYAIAHVRGGKEKGFRWYADGKLSAKKNSFLDFLSVAHHLIAEGYTRPGHIVAEGRSAGGLLVGAVANMAPELFLAIIAGVPFVDVLNTMRDATLPLTPREWREWGDPGTNPAAFETIRAYSPYDNVKSLAYPHILATGGLTDPRVTYWEPAKWIARLRRHNMREDRAILLRMRMDAGHRGQSGRFAILEERAFEYAFALSAASREGYRASKKNANSRNGIEEAE